MSDLMMLYGFIVGVALAQYCLMSFRLKGSLGVELAAFRASPLVKDFFIRYSKEYIASTLWLILGLVVVVFSAFRFTYLIGLLNAETGLILSILLCFYLRELVLHNTAAFVLMRKPKQ